MTTCVASMMLYSCVLLFEIDLYLSDVVLPLYSDRWFHIFQTNTLGCSWGLSYMLQL